MTRAAVAAMRSGRDGVFEIDDHRVGARCERPAGALRAVGGDEETGALDPRWHRSTVVVHKRLGRAHFLKRQQAFSVPMAAARGAAKGRSTPSPAP